MHIPPATTTRRGSITTSTSTSISISVGISVHEGVGGRRGQVFGYAHEALEPVAPPQRQELRVGRQHQGAEQLQQRRDVFQADLIGACMCMCVGVGGSGDGEGCTYRPLG